MCVRFWIRFGVRDNNDNDDNNNLIIIICNKCFGSAPLEAFMFAHFFDFLFQFQAFHYFIRVLVWIVQQCFAKCSANLFKILKLNSIATWIRDIDDNLSSKTFEPYIFCLSSTYCSWKVRHRPAAKVWTTETGFHRITIRNAKHPNNNASRSLFVPLNLEFATLKRKLNHTNNETTNYNNNNYNDNNNNNKTISLDAILDWFVIHILCMNYEGKTNTNLIGNIFV